jgi:pyrroline-5-carboxylate reductase
MSDLSATGTIWLIGCGNMGGAMLRGWIADGIDPARITVVDPALPTVSAGVRSVATTPQGEAAPSILLLSVKPQALDKVAPTLAPLMSAQTLLLSILAGVELASLRQRFPTPKHIVRVMPNMPASIGKGVTALFVDTADTRIREQASALMKPLGAIEWINDETLFDAVTAISGCGPAFVFRFIEAMSKAGAALGLPADQAARLVLRTVEGAALLAARSENSPAALADRVASPGGSTREGLNVLDKNNAFNALMLGTLTASAERNAEMAAAARDSE